MITLLHHIRKIVFTFSFLIALAVYLYVTQNFTVQTQQFTKFSEIFALTAVTYLYFALLPSPLYSLFPKFPLRGLYIRARRAIGVSAFFFALLHASITFFGLLGGFGGLSLLDNKYLLAISLSFTALLILSAMAATSFDRMVRLLGTKWKLLHRFVYLAIVLITIHALMLGNQFTDLSKLIPKLFFAALTVLIFLESIRFDRYLAKRFNLVFSLGLSSLLAVGFLVWSSAYIQPPSATSNTSLSIHAQHIQLAKDAQISNFNSLPNLPSLAGDRTKRFTASFLTGDNIEPNTDTTLKFRIFDANSGNPVSIFLKNYAWPMHLIIVNSSLTSFEHVHPTQTGSNEFSMTTKFPEAGIYHLYIQFQPAGAIEQQIGFTLKVGSFDNFSLANQPVDKNLTKVFGDFEVTLDTHGNLNSQDMTFGKNTLSFTIKDAKTKKPITTLKPFMASFGHLTLINEKTFDFVHVHPYSLTIPTPDANGGPTVDFLPIGIYGPINPGIYRAFGEFSTKIGTDFDVNFTIEIK